MAGEVLWDTNTQHYPIFMEFSNLVGQTGVCMESDIKYETNTNQVGCKCQKWGPKIVLCDTKEAIVHSEI